MNRQEAGGCAVKGGNRAGSRWLRALMAASVAVAALAVMAEPVDARYSRRYAAERKAAKKDPPPAAIKGSLIIAVSLGSQRLTVYDDGVAVAHSPVSSGTAGHPTPTGVFSIIQKNRHHRSNIYSGAPMPFMQRITWSGVALHAGVLPGYPASHGCIRLPNDFAARLWGMTRLGARVIVTRNDVTPVAISHARLAALHAPTLAATPEQRVDALRPGLVPGAGEHVTKAKGVRTAEASDPTVVNDGDPLAAAKAPDAAPSPEPSPSPEPASSLSLKSAPAPETTSAIDLAMPSAAPPVAVPASAPAETPQPSPVIDIAPPPADTSNVAALPLDEVFVPPDRPARSLRAGPVSVFISRKDGRLYVRKRFDPLFSVPVAIKADQPIGTHVFTAAEGEAGTLRWIAVSLPAELPKPVRSASKSERRRGAKAEAARGNVTDMAPVPPSSASEALDRVDLSADLVERIAALITPGASLIISDQGLGHETGLETDFIVLSR
ncbi:L,D-transpeptidase [Xanthobacteraceae bacterium Astr-EGSB]|uniref:L,D-transpeptidase n=1 Tax=Astrobacterium formosum TaxID=3069710 RepID=UPI0027B6FECA|nr:L,D-transpeptidase [Xanthobacteraceae bacterium Astr-EGSB]